MITSTGNPRIKNMIRLQKSAKERREQDVFVVEGLRMFREVPAEARLETYVSEGFLERERAERRQDLKDLDLSGCETVSDAVFARMSDTQTPQGIITLVRRLHYATEDLTGGEAPLILLLEDLQDPGNLGTILRSAEGAGVTGVALSEGCVDIYNPKVIRSTMGSLLRVPFCYVPSLPDLMDEWRKDLPITFYAAHLQGSVPYTEPDYTGAAGFLIGNEGNGLTAETASRADRYIRIPMCGQVESLNASVAASLLVYEALRQRRR